MMSAGFGRSVRRRRDGGRCRSVFGAEICDELCDFLIGEGIGKGRHLRSPVHDLLGDLLSRPLLIVADISKGRSFFVPLKGGAMALRTSFIAIENRAGLLVGFLVCRLGREGSGGCDKEEEGS
jgi:hypothetical protein